MQRVLVANRGEIACRIIRSCREVGLATVAVYSEPDSDSPHVRLADDAVSIGPAAPAESYLNVKKLIAAARSTRTDAIHPGYGFLSENGDFAAAVEEAGFVFIGPTAKTIRQMGDKSAAKVLMQAAGVPVSPGHAKIVKKDFTEIAAEIGYPLLVKAAAGGGGKGM
ncbi:MAG: biotin carboxylase N-terminal domain-containing protein, partial [Candidatus Thermoplasmatota archaeon]|nr:biotin carboxylase N-terminal domain-containing protein [Candidatus Thermoplasmatota archaeon]